MNTIFKLIQIEKVNPYSFLKWLLFSCFIILRYKLSGNIWLKRTAVRVTYKYPDCSGKEKAYSYLNYATATIKQPLISVCGRVLAHLCHNGQQTQSWLHPQLGQLLWSHLSNNTQLWSYHLNSHSKSFNLHSAELTRLTNKPTYVAALWDARLKLNWM